MAEVNVSDVMRRLKEKFDAKKKVRQEFRAKNMSIYEICMHILNRIEDPSIPRMDVPTQRLPDSRVPPVFYEADEIQVMRLETKIMRAKMAFDDVCVQKTTDAANNFSIHAKKTNEWKIRRYAEIQEKERKWKLVADNMAELNEKKAIITRRQIEAEWQALLDCLPEGIQKELLKNYDMPIKDRAELCGGLASDSMFSRLRHQDEEDDHAKGVHWKLRHTAEEVANEFRQRVDISFRASMRTVAQNVVRQAKEEIGKASIQFHTIRSGIRRQIDVIAGSVKEDRRKYIRSAAGVEFERKTVENINNLAKLIV